MFLASRPSFRQSSRVRSLGCLLVLLFAARSATAAPGSQSNPAFLGIAMQDLGGGCLITNVTRCSPAEDAGLREDDVVFAIDGAPLLDSNAPAQARRSTCDVLRERIIAHLPGDVAAFDMRRGNKATTVKVTLSTRADVQHRCFVGQSLPTVVTKDIDAPEREIDLGELRGKTTVLAWFRLDRCVGCGPLLDKVADGIRDRIKEDTPTVIGVTAYDPDPLRTAVVAGRQRVVTSIAPTTLPTRAGFGSTLPLLVAEETDFSQLTLQETDRVQIMIVDCRGIVRFVAPIAPGSEDLEAAVDEVLAAVEQAEHQRTQRR